MSQFYSKYLFLRLSVPGYRIVSLYAFTLCFITYLHSRYTFSMYTVFYTAMILNTFIIILVFCRLRILWVEVDSSQLVIFLL